MFAEPSLLTQSANDCPTIASFIAGLYIREISEFADPCGSFTFYVTSTDPLISWEAVRRNFSLICTLAGTASVALSLRASTKFGVLSSRDGIRVSISPAWWSDASTFTLVGLDYAGNVVPTLLFPATIAVVRVNHLPSRNGRLWKSSKSGDASGAISAIMDGCSTEETDEEVCYMFSITHAKDFCYFI
jgi:hypothetical protein